MMKNLPTALLTTVLLMMFLIFPCFGAGGLGMNTIKTRIETEIHPGLSIIEAEKILNKYEISTIFVESRNFKLNNLIINLSYDLSNVASFALVGMKGSNEKLRNLEVSLTVVVYLDKSKHVLGVSTQIFGVGP